MPRLLGAISLLLLASAAEAAGEPGLESEVDSFVRGVRADPSPFDHPIVAPPQGGPLGWIMAGAYAWYPSVSGDLSLDGEPVDIEDDLGIDGNDWSLLLQAQVSLGGFGFRFSGLFARIEGSGSLDRTFVFGGVAFDVNEDVDSRLSLNGYRMQTMIPIVRTDHFMLAFVGGLTLFDVDVEIVGSVSGRAEESALVPVPLVGGLVQAKLGRFLLEAELSGFYVDFQGYGATVLDAQFSVGITFLKVAAVRVGYRWVSADVHDDADFAVDAVMQGFFVGGSVQF